MSEEGYKPSEDEIKKAKDMMDSKQSYGSYEREHQVSAVNHMEKLINSGEEFEHSNDHTTNYIIFRPNIGILRPVRQNNGAAYLSAEPGDYLMKNNLPWNFNFDASPKDLSSDEVQEIIKDASIVTDNEIKRGFWYEPKDATHAYYMSDQSIHPVFLRPRSSYKPGNIHDMSKSKLEPLEDENSVVAEESTAGEE